MGKRPSGQAIRRGSSFQCLRPLEPGLNPGLPALLLLQRQSSRFYGSLCFLGSYIPTRASQEPSDTRCVSIPVLKGGKIGSRELN